MPTISSRIWPRPSIAPSPISRALKNAHLRRWLVARSLRRGRATPCILPSPSVVGTARGKVGRSPCTSRSPQKTVTEPGALPTGSTSNPYSRLGRQSPHSQGRVMNQLFVGIDISKDRLDVHIQPTEERFSLPHDEGGVAEVVKRLQGIAPQLVAMEATGGYETGLAAALGSAGLPVAVVNPRQIRDYARATGPDAKTDRLGARVIARFAGAVRRTVRPVPDDEAQQLGEVIARRRQLVDMLVAETNRRRMVRAPRLRERLNAHITWLEQAVREVDDDLRRLVRSSTLWRETDDLLRSAPGIGEVTAC